MTQETSATETTDTQTSTTEAGATTSVETTDAVTGTEGTADGDETLLGAAAADDGAGDSEGSADASGETGDGAEASADGLPEKYELTAPEGFEINEAVLSEATPVFKELGLGNEQAQKLMPLGAKLIESHEQAKADEFAAVRAGWAQETKADKDIGGANLKDTQRLAAKALDTFVGPQYLLDDKGEKVLGQDGKPIPNEFRQLLNESGMGDHPAMARFLRKVGEAVAEDGTIARGNSGPAVPKSREEALYPDDVPKQ